MDRFELVEKLVKSTGVSFADAKTALEASDWDLLDAAVWLEKNGKVEGKTSHFTTNPEQQREQQKQREEEQRREERRRENFHNTTASQGNGSRIFHTILSKAKGIIMDNELVICKRTGEVFLEIPVWLFLILLIIAFWPTVIILVLLFLIGFRYRLHGPDLGSENINRVLNRAENAAGDFIDRMKNQHNSQNRGYYDASHGPANTRGNGYYDDTPYREE